MGDKNGIDCWIKKGETQKIRNISYFDHYFFYHTTKKAKKKKKKQNKKTKKGKVSWAYQYHFEKQQKGGEDDDHWSNQVMAITLKWTNILQRMKSSKGENTKRLKGGKIKNCER